jgi:hypothetical protein
MVAGSADYNYMAIKFYGMAMCITTLILEENYGIVYKAPCLTDEQPKYTIHSNTYP